MMNTLLAVGAVAGALTLAAILWMIAVAVEAILRNKARRKCGWTLGIGAGINELYCRFYQRVPLPTADPLPPEGAHLVVALHRCACDPFLIAMQTYRSIRWMMAAEFSDLPAAGWFFNSVKVIPVRRGQADMGAIKAALRALSSGEVVGLFPEGGIRDEDAAEAGKARQGAAMLALRTGAPVIPAAFDNLVSWPELYEGMTYRQKNVRVRFGKPVDLSDLRGRKAGAAELEKATARIMDAIHALNAPSAATPQTAAATTSASAPAGAPANT
jgi:1-acyl-sn-glycerol-3-phosphate acyltransferase